MSPTTLATTRETMQISMNITKMVTTQTPRAMEFKGRPSSSLEPSFFTNPGTMQITIDDPTTQQVQLPTWTKMSGRTSTESLEVPTTMTALHVVPWARVALSTAPHVEPTVAGLERSTNIIVLTYLFHQEILMI